MEFSRLYYVIVSSLPPSTLGSIEHAIRSNPS